MPGRLCLAESPVPDMNLEILVLADRLIADFVAEPQAAEMHKRVDVVLFNGIEIEIRELGKLIDAHAVWHSPRRRRARFDGPQERAHAYHRTRHRRIDRGVPVAIGKRLPENHMRDERRTVGGIVENTRRQLAHVPEQGRFLADFLDQPRIARRVVLIPHGQVHCSRSDAQDLNVLRRIALGIRQRLNHGGKHGIVVAADGTVPIAIVFELGGLYKIIDRCIARRMNGVRKRRLGFPSNCRRRYKRRR